LDAYHVEYDERYAFGDWFYHPFGVSK
jgi:hypothetical protein